MLGNEVVYSDSEQEKCLASGEVQSDLRVQKRELKPG